MSRSRVLAPVVVALLALVLASCATPEQAGEDGSSRRDLDRTRTAPAPTGDRTPTTPRASTIVPRVVAVGDVACAPGEPATRTTCRHADTARLAADLRPHRAVLLGDLQYPDGAHEDFLASYDPTWGRLKDRTLPVPGNHEYQTKGAAGYHAYFGTDPAAPTWSAHDLGSWRVYLLDSNCYRVDCDAQAAWFRRDLRKRPRRCTLLAAHHPRYSSGPHGNAAHMRRFWRIGFRQHLDVALGGHDHDYERFARMGPGGGLRPGRGIVSFVSGAGGKSLYPRKSTQQGSRYFQARRHGVLLLKLKEDRVVWRWRSIDGVVRDRGRHRCV